MCNKILQTRALLCTYVCKLTVRRFTFLCLLHIQYTGLWRLYWQDNKNIWAQSRVPTVDIWATDRLSAHSLEVQTLLSNFILFSPCIFYYCIKSNTNKCTYIWRDTLYCIISYCPTCFDVYISSSGIFFYYGLHKNHMSHCRLRTNFNKSCVLNKFVQSLQCDMWFLRRP
jgi:hypothetical protein